MPSRSTANPPPLTQRQIAELLLKGLAGLPGDAARQQWGISDQDFHHWRDAVMADGPDLLSRHLEAGAVQPGLPFHLLMESIPHAVFAKDRDGRFIYANPAYCAVQGVTLSELVGKDDFFVHPDDLARKYRNDDAWVVRSGEIFTTTEQNACAGRDTLWTEVVKAPIRDTYGNISGVLGIFWDVTEEYSAKEALQESEYNLRQLIRHAPLPICVMGRDGTGLYTNQAFNDLFMVPDEPAVTLKSLLGSLDIDLGLLDEPGTAVDRLIRHVASSGGEHQFSDIVGRKHSLQITCSELKDRVVLMMTDVSRLKETERLLQDRERHYRSIYESLMDGYYRADMDGKLILASPSTVRMLGYDDPTEILGRDIAETFWVIPEQRQSILDELMDKGVVTNYPLSLKKRDGSEFAAEVNARIVSDEDGAPQYIEGSFRDVTARAEAEEKLRVSELFYRSLFENTGTATVLFDNEGVIRKCNQNFEMLAGLGREQIEGNYRWTDFVDKDDLERMWQYHEQRVKSGKSAPREYDFMFVSHGGSRHFIHVTVGIIEGSMSRIASLVDISPRKEAEEELARLNLHLEELVRERTRALTEKARELEEANERLLELDRMKSRFVSTASHELRTPLTSLLGFTKLLQKNFIKHFLPLSEDNPELKRRAELMRSNLEVMGREGARLTRLINILLDLARIESGQAGWDDEPLAVDAVVREAVEVAMGGYQDKPEVELRVDELPAGLLVRVDRDRLQQVLLNLLNNAFKFTDRGEVVVSLRDRGELVHIRVRDTGVGIPADQIDNIFQSFHTSGKGDTMADEAGTGLGLAICRQIVEHYGGSISVDSTPGRGSEFTISLPLFVGSES